MPAVQENLHVLCYSAKPEWENAEKSLVDIERDFEIYFKNNAIPDLLVLPEMFATGFSMNTAKVAAQEEVILSHLRSWSKNYNCAIYGSLAVEENAYKNRGFFIQPDEDETLYDKVHLFSYSGEDKHYSPGKEVKIATYKGWRFLLNICYDLRFPISIYNLQKQSGEARYDVYLNVANWPEPRISAWETLLKARAIENQAYSIGCNRSGTDGNGLHYPLSSFIFDFLGEPIQSALKNELFQSAILYLSQLQNFRTKYPFIQDERAEFTKD